MSARSANGRARRSLSPFPSRSRPVPVPRGRRPPLGKRFYQIAFELGEHPRSLMAELATLGLSVGNQMVVIADPLERRIREVYASVRPGAARAGDDGEPYGAGAASEGAHAGHEHGHAAGVGGAADGFSVGLEAATEAATAVAAPPPSGGADAGVHDDLEDMGIPAVPAASTAVAAEDEARRGEPVAHALAEASVRGDAAAVLSPGPDVAGSVADPRPLAEATVEAASKPRQRTLLIDPSKLGYRNLTPTKAPTAQKPATTGELVPTIDPRAGRLVKEAPKQGVPGVTRPQGRAPGAPPALNPAIARPEPAPGARRDNRSRDGAAQGERRGKQTFQLRGRDRGPKRHVEAVDTAPKSFEVTPPVSLKQFSEVSGIKVADVVKTMFVKHKQVLTPNSMLDEDTLVLLGVEFDRDIRFAKKETREELMIKEAAVESSAEHLVHRPPVVVVMGHVDHGKTSLLDWVRKADVAAHESGGITQHIGAYQVTVADKKISFFDTPGHEAFTEMRRRGSKVTDIVVLVVAADDGVMPQTVEAIEHAKAAEVPIVVAVTKADKVGFKDQAVDRVKQQLAQHGIMVSGWGGEIECFPVATVGPQAGKGVDRLLEHLLLLAEVENLTADPTRAATGVVIEAENNPGRGVLATFLVQQGTLRRGDAVVTGRVFGRVRSMRDDKGATVEEAPPGTPVEVTGLDEVPEVGKAFFVRPDVNEARDIAEQRRARDRELELAAQAKPASVESLFSKIEQGKTKALKVVLKTDVQGSLEAIRARLDAVGNDEVKVQVIRAGVGAVSESDVTLAAAYGAIVLGFHVVADETARMKGKHLGVELRNYRIIYELEQDVRAILEGKLSPEAREQILGHAEILQVFRSAKLGNIAGCRVRDGVIRRDAKARLSRDGVVVWEGAIGSLRREKDDAREVKEGFECGIRLEGYDDLKDGDVIEAFQVEQVARTLGA